MVLRYTITAVQKTSLTRDGAQVYYHIQKTSITRDGPQVYYHSCTDNEDHLLLGKFSVCDSIPEDHLLLRKSSVQL
jgi:hypothetical protein